MESDLIGSPPGSNDNAPIPRSGWVFRKLWPQDGEVLAAHLLRLDPQQRWFRFGRAVADDWIARYATATDWSRTVILGCWIGGELRGIAEVKILGEAWPHSAEASLSVERGFEGRGIGSELFRRGLLIARNRGIGRISIFLQAENLRVQRIVRKAQPKLTYNADQIECEISLGPPDALSIAAEIYDDGCTLALSLWNGLTRAA
jgi:ribosomal protein S18 acetylase RimI-like enzyme